MPRHGTVSERYMSGQLMILVLILPRFISLLAVLLRGLEQQLLRTGTLKQRRLLLYVMTQTLIRKNARCNPAALRVGTNI